MEKRKSLVARIYETLGPEVKVDEQNRTFEITKDGFFFTNLTETYYFFKGYRQINLDYSPKTA
jgi:hypothetical protein